MTIVKPATPDKMIEDVDLRHLPIALPEMRIMIKIISGIGILNLLIGLPSVILVLSLRSPSLVATGMLSLLIFWLLRMVVRHVSQTKSWAEVGVILVCSTYFPTYFMWLCLNNLLEAILR